MKLPHLDINGKFYLRGNRALEKQENIDKFEGVFGAKWEVYYSYQPKKFIYFIGNLTIFSF